MKQREAVEYRPQAKFNFGYTIQLWGKQPISMVNICHFKKWVQILPFIKSKLFDTLNMFHLGDILNNIAVSQLW